MSSNANIVVTTHHSNGSAGVHADYIGRRRTLMLSILCYAISAGLTATARDNQYSSLLIFRFLTGSDSKSREYLQAVAGFQ